MISRRLGYPFNRSNLGSLFSMGGAPEGGPGSAGNGPRSPAGNEVLVAHGAVGHGAFEHPIEHHPRGGGSGGG